VAGSFAGQRIVVVGASAGIGREFARRALADGAEVIVTGRRQQRLDELVAEVGRGIPQAVDITDPASCAALADTVRAEFGSLDLLFCSAGYSPLRYFDEVTPDDWRRILEINVIGIHQLIRTVLPVSAPGALIAVMSSESVAQPRQALGAYTASKAALELSMRVWRQEHPELRYTTIIVGGTFPTDFGSEFDMDRLARAMGDWARHGVVQERLMDTEQVAAALAGTLASFVDLPDVNLDTVVVRSPSAVVGSSEQLEATAAENLSLIGDRT